MIYAILASEAATEKERERGTRVGVKRVSVVVAAPAAAATAVAGQ